MNRTSFQHRGLTIEREHAGSEYDFTAKHHGRLVGDAKVRESETHGLIVEMIAVEDRDRRRRVGTALYEAALKLSCETKKPLVSDFTRSRFAEAFWRKQQKKGRATCAKRNADGQENVWDGPVNDARDQVERGCDARFPRDSHQASACVESRMAKVEERLPKPRGKAWPCFRWKLKPRTTCANPDLSASLRGRR